MLSVRERPPLRVGIRVVSPSGREHRWAGDEPDPADSPQGLRWSSTVPGGFENCDCKLVRKPQVDYADLDRLSTLRLEGAGGRCAGEYRLERTPRVSGDQMAISPSAVGWQAALEDNKAVREIYVDIDLTQWQPASVKRQINAAATYAMQSGQMQPDTMTGNPSLGELISGPAAAAPGLPDVETYYDAGPGNQIASVYYAWTKSATVNAADANWWWSMLLSTDDVLTTHLETASLRAAGPGTGTLAANRTGYRFARATFQYNAAGLSQSVQYALFWTVLAVYGDQGLPLAGAAGATSAQGVYESDVCKHAVGKYGGPIVADPANVDQTSFPIPQLAFRDSTTAGEIVRQATRFSLNDWMVWESARIASPRFHLHARGTYGRHWRARVGPAGLEETGPQVDRLWNSITVQFQDVAGNARTVGPPGSGADTEDSTLLDTDPTNPANEAGLTRRDLLTMGTSTASGAIKVGATFLAQAKLLDTSGRAQLQGWVVDDRGVLHPYWAVRAGDSISFVDAHDTTERRIVRADNDDTAKTCTVDLDAPPEGLQSLLERLSVGLVQLGLA